MEEQDLLGRLEKVSGEDEDTEVDCSLRLGPGPSTPRPKTSSQLQLGLQPTQNTSRIVRHSPLLLAEQAMQSYGGLHGNYGWLNENLGLLDAKGKAPVIDDWGMNAPTQSTRLPCLVNPNTMNNGFNYFAAAGCSSSSNAPRNNASLTNGFGRYPGVFTPLPPSSNVFPTMNSIHQAPMARSMSVGSVINMRCLACGTTKTPLWRPGPGPKGNKFLCNACGIRYHKELRKNSGAKK